MLRPSAFIEPCLADAPQGTAGRFRLDHEVKFDGFRIQIHKDGSDVALYSRNGHDFTIALSGPRARLLEAMQHESLHP